MTDNLPANKAQPPLVHGSLADAFPVIDESKLEVKRGDPIENIQEVDLALANASIKAVVAGWGHIKNLSGLTRMLAATTAAIKQRRDVLGLPYGAPPQISKRDTYYTLD